MRSSTDPLRSSLVAQSAVLVGLVGMALLARAVLPLGPLYPLKAAGCFGIVMMLSAARVRDHHRFDRFGPANQVTTVRAALVALIVSLLVGEPGPPEVAAAVVGVSLLVTLLDGIDGWAARGTGMASEFGARFDMEIDSVLILILAILAWLYGKAGPWVVLSGLLRYLFVASGWVWDWMRRPLRPTLRGKAVCVIQIVALILAIVPAIRPPVSTAIAIVGLVALCGSFLVDTWWLWQRRTG